MFQSSKEKYCGVLLQHLYEDICRISVERQVDEARDLVNRILAGDAKAFKTLVEQNQRLVSHIVFKMIPNETEREDLSQEVFMRVYRNLGRFEFRSKLSTWIARITYNTCGNYLEKKKIPLYEDLAPEQKTIDPVQVLTLCLMKTQKRRKSQIGCTMRSTSCRFSTGRS